MITLENKTKKMETLTIENLHSVGATGFEPATTWSQTRRATGLRYTPYDINLHMSELLKKLISHLRVQR